MAKDAEARIGGVDRDMGRKAVSSLEAPSEKNQRAENKDHIATRRLKPPSQPAKPLPPKNNNKDNKDQTPHGAGLGERNLTCSIQDNPVSTRSCLLPTKIGTVRYVVAG